MFINIQKIIMNKHTQETNQLENRSSELSKLFKKSFWLKNVEINDENYPRQCLGGCNRTSKSIKITYENVKRNLCYDCFIEKNQELENKYKCRGKCQIILG
tara:strand:+ start:158 stop:460 length:303 start_codon:yes stop_codon:yes gene_type:complete